jgi:hypothetical protein
MDISGHETIPGSFKNVQTPEASLERLPLRRAGAHRPLGQQFCETNRLAAGLFVTERFMNVISARTTESSSPLVRAFTARAGIALPRREPAEWLPTPPYRVRPRIPSPRLKMPTSAYSASERVLFGLVVCLAIFGIAYGLSCALDLVQHWAQFNTGIERLIQ